MNEKIDSFLRHPFILAIAGTILGSLVIPPVAGQAQKRATREDTRIKQAIEVMTTSSSINATLNKLKTAFTSFEQHALASSPSVYNERRKELEDTILKLYREFDSVAWWWPWNIYYQARLLRLVPEDRLARFGKSIDAYTKNCETTVHLLGRPWDEYLTGDPSPVGKQPIMEQLDKQLRDLEHERNDLAIKMAAEFQ
jgi:hypothetical protein